MISVSATNVSVSIDVVVELEGDSHGGEDFPTPVSLTFNLEGLTAKRGLP